MAIALLVGCDRTGPRDHSVAEPAAGAADGPAWIAALEQAEARLDETMPGEFGLHIRRLGADAGVVDRGDDRDWYLSSTIKIPVAIAVLEKVDAGELTLADEIELKATDFVDGSGDMVGAAPGSRFRIATLLEKSLRDSDSTATDMLVRKVGERDLNRRIRAWVGAGFNDITTILQVRYDAYGPLHPGVARLDNRDIMALRQAGSGEARLAELARRLDVPRESLDADSLEAVFEQYYQTGRNSARLDAFARLLERIAIGEILTAPSRGILLDHMRAITTGDRRIAAGLPAGAAFAQKTGTQIGRACNVGILNPEAGREGATVVVACAEGYQALGQAEQAFQGLGRALGEAGLAR
jgi:beta-lactamase class A